MKKNIEDAKIRLQKIREIIAKNPTSIFKMSKEEAINTLRKTRDAIWKEKLATHH